MTDTPDAATAWALLEAACKTLGRYQNEAAARGDFARAADLRQGAFRLEQELAKLPDPAPKRLGLLTDWELTNRSQALRHDSHAFHDEIADFLDAARALAGEVPDDLTTVRRLRDSFANGSLSHDYWDAVYRVLARLAGLPTEEG